MKIWITSSNKWISNIQCRFIRYIFIPFSLALNSHLLLSFTHMHTPWFLWYLVWCWLKTRWNWNDNECLYKCSCFLPAADTEVLYLFAWCFYISLYVPLWMNFLYMRWNCAGLLHDSLCVCENLCCWYCYHFICGFHEWPECYGKANAQRWSDK